MIHFYLFSRQHGKEGPNSRSLGKKEKKAVFVDRTAKLQRLGGKR